MENGTALRRGMQLLLVVFVLGGNSLARAAGRGKGDKVQLTCRPTASVNVGDASGKIEVTRDQPEAALTLFVEFNEIERSIRIRSQAELARPDRSARVEARLTGDADATEIARLMEKIKLTEVKDSSGTAMCSAAEWSAVDDTFATATPDQMASGAENRSAELRRKGQALASEPRSMSMVYIDAKSVRAVQNATYATAVWALDRRTLRAVLTLARAGADNAGLLGRVFQGTTGRIWHYQCAPGWPTGLE